MLCLWMRHQHNAPAKGLGIDLIELRDQVGEDVVIDNREVTIEGRAQPVELVLGKEAHGNYSIFSQDITPWLS